MEKDKSEITIEECIDMYDKKNKCIVLNNGIVIGFVEDK